MNTLIKQNDSRQRNLPKSLLKGAVINLGVQALGKNLNKNNFWQSLLVGAAGGFGDYFGGNVAMGAVLGCGNALINKSNFLGTTAKYAALSFSADGVMKIAEAKAEEPFENKRWKIVLDYRLPGGDLPFYHQNDPSVGCTQETLNSIGEYLRVPIRIWDYPVDWDTNDKGYKNGADFELLAAANGLYTEIVPKYKQPNELSKHNPDIVGRNLIQNFPMAITYETNGNLPHTVGINRIVRLKNIVNPKKADRYIIQVMDPLYSGKYQILPLEKFYYGKIVLVKSKSYA